MRGGRGFGGVVVAHQGQHTAILRGAGEIGVTEHVAGAVDARALAVPEPENAIELALAAQFGLLRAPDGGCSEFLVQPGQELDVGGGQFAGRAHELLIEAAQGRAAISREIAAGVQPGAAVALFLHQNRADQGLIAGHQHMRLTEVVFVVESDRLERHQRALWVAFGQCGIVGKRPSDRRRCLSHIGCAAITQSAENRNKSLHWRPLRSISFPAPRGEGSFSRTASGAFWRNAAIGFVARQPPVDATGQFLSCL